MTVKEVIKKLDDKKVSSKEIIEFCLDKINKEDKKINSFLHINENALSGVERIDKLRLALSAGALLGVPYAVKDNMLAEGMKATAGSKILENYTAPYNATAVANLNEEGAVVLGKTNMDEFAMGSSTENSAYGPTKNPYDTSRVPGGSSGGSAAAVAAEFVPFAMGSDTGGSIRQPAAFCGVVGFKPTYGTVSRYGLIAMASSLDQIGTFTHTVEDAKFLFPYIAQRDSLDSTSIKIEEDGKEINPKKLKLGLIKEFFGEGLDEEIKKNVLKAVDVYKKMGAEIKEISLPRAPYGLAVYYIIMPSEASSNLARYDGVKYGHHQKESSVGELLKDYLKTRGEGFGEEVKRRIMLGTYTLSAGYYDAYYLKAQKVRKLIEEDYIEAFKDVDAIISPTTPTLPFKLGEKTQDPLEMYLSDVYTVGANLTGMPSISVPVDPVKVEGKLLPVGMQFTCNHKEDYKLLKIAQLYEKELGI